MTSSDSAFASLADRAVHEVLAREPELATDLGYHAHDGRLDDRSAEGEGAAGSAYSTLLQELSGVDEEQLDDEELADLAILRGALEQRIFSIEELREIEWNPLVYNPGNAFYPLIARATVPVSSRLRAIAARLLEVPALVDLARQQLERPPRIHLETALAQNTGTIALLGTELESLLEEDPGLRPLVEPARSSAVEALERHASFLEELSGQAGGDFRLGADLFRRKLPLVLHSDIPPDRVPADAARNVEEVEAVLFEVACEYLGVREAGADRNETVRAALDRVATARPDDTSIVASAAACLDGLAEGVRRLGFVTVPDDPARVEVMPEFRRGIAVAYCDSPGPFEEGGDTFLAVAPTPSDWPRERVDSFCREYNLAHLVNLMAHEAIPGHALQLAHARRYNGATLVRKAFQSGPFCEGWAVHAEKLMAESGHGGLPVRLQQLKMQLRMSINAILDAEVHADDMSEDAAVELMVGRGYQEEGEAVGKWRRACLSSCQLSTYYVGYAELARVFADTGPHGNFDGFLAHGSPPPSLLRQLVSNGAGES